MTKDSKFEGCIEELQGLFNFDLTEHDKTDLTLQLRELLDSWDRVLLSRTPEGDRAQES